MTGATHPHTPSPDPAGVEGKDPWWVVTDFCEQGHTADAVFVRAPEEGAAADLALPELQGIREDRDGGHGVESVDQVFVAPWNGRVAFAVQARAERAELQCCGGNYLASLGGHSACCPVVGAPSVTCGDCRHPISSHTEAGCEHVVEATDLGDQEPGETCNCATPRSDWD